jgi:3-methyl-2-oxobutanoate hydroxymethyltransferase
MATAKVTAAMLPEMKARGERIPSLTAYDYPTARLLDEAGIPLILVGDSLGMVTLGYPDTTHVTMEEMEHHVRAVARAQPKALIGADLPFQSYESEQAALTNARRLIAAGAEAVKAEGGRGIIQQVRAIISAGIPFIGHLGMLPQSIHKEGGYRIKGKSESERSGLMADAQALEEAGACALVLELVAPEVAKEITHALRIPTIGIGSGSECDGQILVINDLIGTFPWFTPRFVATALASLALPRLNASEEMRNTISQWKGAVQRHAKKAESR